MAKFYAEVWGDNSKAASRQGHRVIKSHTRTWDHGIKVVSDAGVLGEVIFHVFLTGGSTGAKKDELIFTSNTNGILYQKSLDHE